MSALSGDFYGFDDLFPQGFFSSSSSSSSSGHMQRVQYHILDSVLIAPDEVEKSIALVVHDSTRPQMPGAGIKLTVVQATQVIALLRDGIHHVEHQEYIVEEPGEQQGEDDDRPLDDRL